MGQNFRKNSASDGWPQEAGPTALDRLVCPSQTIAFGTHELDIAHPDLKRGVGGKRSPLRPCPFARKSDWDRVGHKLHLQCLVERHIVEQQAMDDLYVPVSPTMMYLKRNL